MANKLNMISPIKEIETIEVETKLPVELNKLTDIKLMINELLDTGDMKKIEVPTIYLAEAKEALAQANKKLKDAMDKNKVKAKAISLAINDLEDEIKKAVIEKVEITKTPKKDREGNLKTDEDGVIQYKESHNLNTQLFSFTPQTTKIDINYDRILELGEQFLSAVNFDFGSDENKKKAEFYASFLTPVTTYALDKDKLNKYRVDNGNKNLPIKEFITEEKLSIKWKDARAYGEVIKELGAE